MASSPAYGRPHPGQVQGGEQGPPDENGGLPCEKSAGNGARKHTGHLPTAIRTTARVPTCTGADRLPETRALTTPLPTGRAVPFDRPCHSRHTRTDSSSRLGSVPSPGEVGRRPNLCYLPVRAATWHRGLRSFRLSLLPSGPQANPSRLTETAMFATAADRAAAASSAMSPCPNAAH